MDYTLDASGSSGHPHAAQNSTAVGSKTSSILESGVLYSDIGFSDICSIRFILAWDWYEELESISSVLHQCPYWNYGSGEHHRETRPILGSVVLSAYAVDSTRLLILHLVLSGSSKCVVGRNLTSQSDILQVGESILCTCGTDGKPVRLPLIDRRHYLFLPLLLLAEIEYHCAHAATTLPCRNRLARCSPHTRPRTPARVRLQILCGHEATDRAHRPLKLQVSNEVGIPLWVVPPNYSFQAV